MAIAIYFAIFYLGCIIGSFLNVVILRLPKEKTLNGRSACPHCGHSLAGGDLVPVFSYLFLKGKCQYCKHRISPRYAVIEIITGLLFLFCFWQIMPVNPAGYLLLAQDFIAVMVFVAVFVIDFEHFLILDSVVFMGILGLCVVNLLRLLLLYQPILSWQNPFLLSLWGAVVCALPFFVIWFFSKGKWMGFGDVKFCLFLGALLGLKIALVSLFISVIIGGIFSVFLLALGKKGLKSRIPFGTFLSLGGFLAVFYGQFLLNWYLARLGF